MTATEQQQLCGFLFLFVWYLCLCLYQCLCLCLFGCLYLCLYDICVYDYMGICVYVSLGVCVYAYIVFKKRPRRLYQCMGGLQKWAYQGPGGILLFMLLDFNNKYFYFCNKH